MPETAPRELMILVERVVRPLPIPLSRQKRLRTELLQHLQAIYAEELARGDDAVAALTRTEQRFGDSGSLTTELQRTVRRWEPWECWLERCQAQRPAESAWRFVQRVMGRFVFIVATLMLLLMLDHHFFGTERLSVLKLQVGAAALTFLTLWLGCFLLFGLQMGIEWERPRRRWSRMIPLSLGLVISWPLSLAVMMWLAGGHWSDYSIPLISSIAGGCLSVVGGALVGVLYRRESLYRREWAELEINAA